MYSIIDALRQNWIWIDGWQDYPRQGEAARLVEFQCSIRSGTVVHISADTRYKLRVNGKRVCVGPARGCEQRWYYDTVDISPYLHTGTNILHVEVLRYFPSVNAGIPFARTNRPGFSLVGIDVRWMARECDVYCPNSDDGTLLQCFERAGTAHGEWREAASTPDVIGAGILPTWRLSPRMIPLAEESTATFQSIRHAESSLSVDKWTALFCGTPLTLPPHSTHVIEVEYAVHNTAFVNLRAVGDAIAKITYAESYAGREDGHMRKGDRTKREGQSLFGPSDTLRIDGKVDYEPLWWRAFRYLLVDITVGASLTLESFTATQTNYPMNITASWKSDKEAERMWEISIHTLRNCMFDGYSDCPFYEQLQYCEDTRSAMLFHYILSGDDRLARQAITAFADSQLPDGMVCGRAPAHGTQVITGFSLFWVLQVCDHHLHFGDDAFSRHFIPQINCVLTYFQRHLADGIVQDLPQEYWSFIDWVQTWQGDEDFSDGGVPLKGRATGTWSYFSMLYLYARKQYSRLLTDLGEDSPKVTGQDAINEHFYDGLYLDAIDGGYSQHSQMWAVLSGCVEGEDARRILQTPNIAKTSYPMTHYLFRALAATDLYDQNFHAMWDPWRRMMEMHLTTWAEDDVNERSDCHEWSSLPIYEYAYEVLGLQPLKPAWNKVLFAPRLLFPMVTAAVNLGARGLARVSWADQDGAYKIYLDLPAPLHLVTRLQGKEVDHGITTSIGLTA